MYVSSIVRFRVHLSKHAPHLPRLPHATDAPSHLRTQVQFACPRNAQEGQTIQIQVPASNGIPSQSTPAKSGQGGQGGQGGQAPQRIITVVHPSPYGLGAFGPSILDPFGCYGRGETTTTIIAGDGGVLGQTSSEGGSSVQHVGGVTVVNKPQYY